jgi:hypothetical protein
LHGSKISSEGKIQLLYSGRWHYVCGTGWDITAGNVVCRHLGYQYAIYTVYGFEAWSGTSQRHLNVDLRCSANVAGNSKDCIITHNEDKICHSSEDVGVVCATTRLHQGVLRINGQGNYTGHLEVYSYGMWGSICNNGWGFNEAYVACRQMGFTRTCDNHDNYLSYVTSVPSSQSVWLEGIKCTGKEVNLTECGIGVISKPTKSCNSSDHIRIRCCKEVLEIFVKTNVSMMNVTEAAKTVDAYFELVNKDSPEVQIEATFPFQLKVFAFSALATANEDWITDMKAVSFVPGQKLSTPFTLIIEDDMVSEGPEDITILYNIISSSVPQGYRVEQLPTSLETIVQIIDNDVSFISFEEKSTVVTESVGVVELRLISNNVFERVQFLDICAAANGTAANGSDYVLLSSRVSFSPQSCSNSSDVIKVGIANDNVTETAETFMISFSISDTANASGARYGSITQHTIVIVDDDGKCLAHVPSMEG